MKGTILILLGVIASGPAYSETNSRNHEGSKAMYKFMEEQNFRSLSNIEHHLINPNVYYETTSYYSGSSEFYCFNSETILNGTLLREDYTCSVDGYILTDYQSMKMLYNMGSQIAEVTVRNSVTESGDSLTSEAQFTVVAEIKCSQKALKYFGYDQITQEEYSCELR